MRRLAVVLLIILLTACGNFPSRSSNSPKTSPLSASSSPKNSPSGQDSPSPLISQPGNQKSGMTGIIDQCGDMKKILCDGLTWSPHPGYESAISGVVVNTSWKELQTSFGGPLTPDNPIDRWISHIRVYNLSHAPIGLKIRIYMGVYAPDWAKNLNGAPFDLTSSSQVGHFWTDDYAAASNSLMIQIANKYDNIPFIRDVELNRCSMGLSPLLRPSDKGSIQTLIKEGFSFQNDQKCIRDMIDSGHYFHHIALSLKISPYGHISPDGSFKIDEAFSLAMITYCRDSLRGQCIIDLDPLGAEYDKIYASLKSNGVGYVCEVNSDNVRKNLDICQKHAAQGAILSNYASLTGHDLTEYGLRLAR